MPLSETMTFAFGDVKRHHAPIKSPTLLTLPETERPDTILACTTCPAGRWYFDEDHHLACHCRERRYVSWRAKQKAIVLCDDREELLEELDEREES
ncbi:MAG: hypothetical protein V4459_00930 [Pseudomonadota bacterium]